MPDAVAEEAEEIAAGDAKAEEEAVPEESSPEGDAAETESVNYDEIELPR